MRQQRARYTGSRSVDSWWWGLNAARSFTFRFVGAWLDGAKLHRRLRGLTRERVGYSYSSSCRSSRSYPASTTAGFFSSQHSKSLDLTSYCHVCIQSSRFWRDLFWYRECELLPSPPPPGCSRPMKRCQQLRRRPIPMHVGVEQAGKEEPTANFEFCFAFEAEEPSKHRLQELMWEEMRSFHPEQGPWRGTRGFPPSGVPGSPPRYSAWSPVFFPARFPRMKFVSRRRCPEVARPY